MVGVLGGNLVVGIESDFVENDIGRNLGMGIIEGFVRNVAIDFGNRSNGNLE